MISNYIGGGVLLILCAAVFVCDCGPLKTEESQTDDSAFLLPYAFSGQRRSSRSVADPAEMHSRKAGPKKDNSSRIGKPCVDGDIFGCGQGATCVNKIGQAEAVCECFPDFALNPTNGSCIKRAGPDPTDDPPSTPTGHSDSSYSAAAGAIIAILILVSLGAGVYYGERHQVLTRIRNRLPLSLRCWPFPRIRRSRDSDADNTLAFAVPLD